MKLSTVNPRQRDANLSSKVYIQNYYSKKVKEIYQEMISRNVTIDITVMNVMIKSLLRAGDIRSAESLFDFLLKQEDKRREKKNNEDEEELAPLSTWKAPTPFDMNERYRK